MIFQYLMQKNNGINFHNSLFNQDSSCYMRKNQTQEYQSTLKEQDVQSILKSDPSETCKFTLPFCQQIDVQLSNISDLIWRNHTEESNLNFQKQIYQIRQRKTRKFMKKNVEQKRKKGKKNKEDQQFSIKCSKNYLKSSQHVQKSDKKKINSWYTNREMLETIKRFRKQCTYDYRLVEKEYKNSNKCKNKTVFYVFLMNIIEEKKGLKYLQYLQDKYFHKLNQYLEVQYKNQTQEFRNILLQSLNQIYELIEDFIKNIITQHQFTRLYCGIETQSNVHKAKIKSYDTCISKWQSLKCHNQQAFQTQETLLVV